MIQVSFTNLVLPVVSSEIQAAGVCAPSPETPEVTKSTTNKKELGSGNRRRKGRGKVQQQPTEERNEEVTPEVTYKPGMYLCLPSSSIFSSKAFCNSSCSHTVDFYTLR